jgi:hypothetical protein
MFDSPPAPPVLPIFWFDTRGVKNVSEFDRVV